MPPVPSGPAPELRHDVVTGRPVVVATGRAGRPHTAPALEPGTPAVVADCPFCPGHEALTPPEVARTGRGAPDTPGWRVRAFPNLYPIVGPPGAGPAAATGAHEVVVLSPAHDAPLERLDDAAAVEVLVMLRDRSRAHLAAGHVHAQPFVNHGRSAGASLAHPHAQLVSVDLTPPEVAAAIDRMDAAEEDLVAADLAHAERAGTIVESDADAVAWSPHGAPSPFALRVTSRAGGDRFDLADDDAIAAVARVLRRTLARLASVLGDPPYNAIVRTGLPAAPSRCFRWHVDVVPRLGVLAGFEQGTGILVNVVAPEDAARALQEVPDP